MRDMGLMSCYLGIEVSQSDKGIFNCQNKYARDILEKFKMENSKPVDTPAEIYMKLSKKGQDAKVNLTYFKSLIGSLRYLIATRPDILYGVGLVSR